MLKGSGVGVMNVGGPFVLNIDPLLLDIGGIKIWYYGLAYALGFFGILVWLMRRRLTIGLPVNEVWSLSIIYAVSSLIGGRVFEILVYEWDIYKADPLEMLRFWHGGMASHGVILGALAGTLFFCLAYKRNVFLIADELVVPAALFLALGLFGNHINGEVYGYSTGVWWAIRFPYAEGFRHPIALYDGIKNLLLIPILLSVRRRVIPIPGTLLAHFIFWYGFLRLFVDYFRDYNSELFGVGTGQYYNLLMAAIGLLLISRFSRRHYNRKIDLNTIKFAPAAILSRMASHKNITNYGKAIVFILLLLFSMTIPSGWSQEWLRQLIVNKGI
jgi:phosphatidylglycerol:prolipoprotein diacylglycerol transferase